MNSKKIICSLVVGLYLVGLSSCQNSPVAGSTALKTEQAGSQAGAKVLAMKTDQKNSTEFKLNIPYRTLDTSKSVTLFSFGSCSDQTLEQPLWEVIAKNKPQLMLMLGDNIYASTKDRLPIVNEYLKLSENQEFRSLRESVPMLATWDDHDFGQNDGGESNPNKQEARNAFLNYWGYLKQTLPKNQTALYHSRLIGKAPERLQIILLDTRWDRSDLFKNPSYDPENKEVRPIVYLPHPDKKTKILSLEQWSWLESELKKPAELRLIISSIQIIAENQGFEKWGNFPHEKEKLLGLIKRLNLKNVVALSGDRHLSVVSRQNISKNLSMFEITTSALNRPSRLKFKDEDLSYVSETFGEINFGLGTIDWKKRRLEIEIRDSLNATKLSQTINF